MEMYSSDVTHSGIIVRDPELEFFFLLLSDSRARPTQRTMD